MDHLEEVEAELEKSFEKRVTILKPRNEDPLKSL